MIGLCSSLNMWKYCFIISLCYTVAFCDSVPTSGVAPWVTLNDGNHMPSFGIGTGLGFGQRGTSQSDHDALEKALDAAIDAGYRHMDTARMYHTEKEVGRVVNKKIKDGLVKREDIFVTTKLWNDKHGRGDVLPALRESLADLNLEYVDLYLIHWPISTYSNNTLSDVDYLETWQGMIEAKRLGLARSIGVCNFNVSQLERLIGDSGVAPAVLQVEVNLNLQQPQLRKFSRDHNISVMAYTPFGTLFPGKATPQSPPPRVDDPKMVTLAKKYGKTVPQIVLRYLFELGVVPIPKTLKKERAVENISIFDFQLDEEDRKLLESYNKNYRTVNPLGFWGQSKYYSFERE